MEKNWIVYAIGALLLIGISLLFVNMTTNLCKDEKGNPIFNFFECQFNKDKLTASINCAYISCTEGCKSSKIDAIKSGDFSCKEWCDLNLKPWDKDSIICDFGRPIEIKLDKPSELDNKNLVEFKCINDNDMSLYKKGANDGWYELDFFNRVKTLYDNPSTRPLVLIDKNLINTYGEREGTLCFNRLTVSEGPLYINYGIKWGYVGGQGCVDRKFGYVSNSPVNKVIDKNKIRLEAENYFPLNDHVGLLIKRDPKNFLPADPDKCGNWAIRVKVTVFCNGVTQDTEICQDKPIQICNGEFKLVPRDFPTQSFLTGAPYPNAVCQPYLFEVS